MSARLRAWFRNAPVVASEESASDGDLVRRFADVRDEAAFAELVRRHGPMVLATCRRVLHPDVHTADDAFQAAFLVLATRAAAVRPPERVGAFLHGVAVLVAKKARAWVRKLAPSAPTDLDRVPAPPVEADPDTAEVRAKIDDALAGLPAKYRAAVVLCDLEGRSRTEAAAALGWREGTLSGRLARARRLLADRLARRGVVLPAAGAAGLGVLVPASAAPANVPVQLAASTVRAATLVAAGATAGEAIPASVAALAKGVPMHSTTFKLFAAGVAALALALGGFGLYAITAAPSDPPPPIEAPALVAAPVPNAPAPTWTTKHTFTHQAPITALAAGGGLVASGDKAGVLVLWDTRTGKRQEELLGLAQLVNPDKPISDIRFTADGAKLLAVTQGGKTIYQFAVGQKEPEVRNYDTLTEYSDWKTVGITTNGDGWLHISPKKSAAALSPNALSGNFIRSFVSYQFAHTEAVTHAAAEKSHGTAVVTVAGAEKPTLRMWSTFKKEPLWEKELGRIAVTGVLVSPGGKLVTVTGGAGQVWVFDAKTGKEVVLTGTTTGAVRSAAFDPDGKRIVVGCDDKTAHVYNAETGKELAVLKGHEGAVTAVCFDSGGETIATGSADKTVKVWEVRAPAPVETGWTTRHALAAKNPITAVAFGPDRVATADREGVLTLWNPQTGARKETASVGTWKFKPITRVQFLPDGTVRLVTGWTDEPKDRYYLDFPPPFAPDKMQSTHSNAPFGATADGAFSFGLDNDGRDLTLWPIDPDAGKKGGVTVQARFRHEDTIRHAAGADANTVATITAGRSAPVLRLWSKGKDEPVWEVKLWEKGDINTATGVVIAPGGKLVAVTGAEGQVWVFDARTGKLVSKANKLPGAVWSAAFGAENKRLVAGCEDGTARVYDTETGEQLALLKGHEGAVTAVAFTRDGKQIVTGSTDKTARVWEFKAAADAPKPASPADDKNKAVKRLQGKWQVTKMTVYKGPLATEPINDLPTVEFTATSGNKGRVIFDGATFVRDALMLTRRGPGTTMPGAFELDSARKEKGTDPDKAIDLIVAMSDGEEKTAPEKRTVRGLYEFDGKTLRLCIPFVLTEDAKRPTKFDPQTADEFKKTPEEKIVIVLEREKP